MSDLDKTARLIERYQKCAERIWLLFPSDPLPDDDHAQLWVDRLESILARELLIPRGSEK